MWRGTILTCVIHSTAVSQIDQLLELQIVRSKRMLAEHNFEPPSVGHGWVASSILLTVTLAKLIVWKHMRRAFQNVYPATYMELSNEHSKLAENEHAASCGSSCPVSSCGTTSQSEVVTSTRQPRRSGESPVAIARIVLRTLLSLLVVALQNRKADRVRGIVDDEG